jgi:ketosteroid isomerase-like protein
MIGTRKQELVSMKAVLEALRDFLAAASRGDKEVLNNFFADDVIYTGSSGIRMDKAAVMNSIGAHAANGVRVSYQAQDIAVQPYDDTVIVNFQMVVVDGENKGKREASYFRNTGTFLKRNGKWQVVAWQATKSPEAEAKP